MITRQLNEFMMENDAVTIKTKSEIFGYNHNSDFLQNIKQSNILCVLQ